MKHHFYLMLLLMIGTTSMLWGEIKFDRISLSDGLSQSTVYCITQDDQGFIWIGTQDGLNRYDGYNFLIYKNDPFDSTSLSDNYITSLLHDKTGNLWIGTFGGVLNKFNPANGTFTRYQLAGSAIRTIHEDRREDGRYLWLGTSGGGLVRFEMSSGEIIRFLHDPQDENSISNDRVWSISECPQGDLWIATNGGGLNQFIRNEGRFVHYRHNPRQPESLSSDMLRSIHWDRAGTLWIGSDGRGFSRMESASEGKAVFTHYFYHPANRDGVSSGFIWDILEDHNGNIWLATRDGGLCQMIRESDDKVRFQWYRYDPADPKSLINNIIISLFQDRTGILWIAAFGGISKLNPNQAKFTHFKRNPSAEKGLSHSVVMSIYEDSGGDVWVGTFGGLNRLTLRYPPSGNNALQSLPAISAVRHYKHQPGKSTSLTENRIWTICEDGRENLWVGTLRGLNRFGPARKKITRYLQQSGDSTSLGSGRIWALARDGQGELWVGTDGGGLHRYLAESDNFQRWTHNATNPASISHNTIRAIYPENDSLLWIGTFGGGLNKLTWDSKKGQALFYAYQNDINNPESISSNRIFAIHRTKDGILWVGTDGGGLNRFDPQQETFSHFTERDGLPNNVVYGILEDDAGSLWLSTNNGLSRFDPSRRGSAAFRNYDVDDGLQHTEFNQGAYFQGKSGRMYFGGINGLNVFDPQTIQDNPRVPPLVFTDFKLFYESVPVSIENSDEPETDGELAKIQSRSLSNALQLTSNSEDAEEIILAYDENVFSFEFAALDYTNPAKNQYAYMLEGFDRDWIYSGNRRYASYTNLDGGSYIFRVKGSNSDRIWNETGIALRIRINPPFWKTWWFRLLSVLLVLGLLYLLYRNRVEKLLAMERTRLRISRDLHDEVSATLSSISYFAQAIHNAMPDDLPSSPRRFLGLITESAGEAQDAMNDIIWSINPQNDQWDKLVAKLRRYASDLLESRNIDYQMTIPDTFPAKTLGMERRRTFWLLFKEMVTNAARHSNCEKLAISLTFEGPLVRLVVADDGCGFQAGTPSDRNGLKNIAARAEMLAGDLKLETAPGEGTRWDLVFRL